ncbi:MAG: DUF1684 domain-containing protein [Chloroflexota bacterium]
MLQLLDYRRTTAEMYQFIRERGTDSSESIQKFRQTRDRLFREHSQTPLSAEQLVRFNGLRYYDYDLAYRVMGALNTDVERTEYNVDLGKDGAFTMTQIAQVTFTLPTGTGTLGVFWIEGYGGGIFVPFRDSTNGSGSYGGGRYLYDTIKGADPGATETMMLLDFNYAYHPSCYYNERWVCPLAPPQNHLNIPVPAGETLLDTI